MATQFIDYPKVWQGKKNTDMWKITEQYRFIFGSRVGYSIPIKLARDSWEAYYKKAFYDTNPQLAKDLEEMANDRKEIDEINNKKIDYLKEVNDVLTIQNNAYGFLTNFLSKPLYIIGALVGLILILKD